MGGFSPNALIRRTIAPASPTFELLRDDSRRARRTIARASGCPSSTPHRPRRCSSWRSCTSPAIRGQLLIIDVVEDVPGRASIISRTWRAASGPSAVVGVRSGATGGGGLTVAVPDRAATRAWPARALTSSVGGLGLFAAGAAGGGGSAGGSTGAGSAIGRRLDRARRHGRHHQRRPIRDTRAPRLAHADASSASAMAPAPGTVPTSLCN